MLPYFFKYWSNWVLVLSSYIRSTSINLPTTCGGVSLCTFTLKCLLTNSTTPCCKGCLQHGFCSSLRSVCLLAFKTQTHVSVRMLSYKEASEAVACATVTVRRIFSWKWLLCPESVNQISKIKQRERRKMYLL